MVQIGILTLIGIVALLVSVLRGAEPDWLRLLDTNASLLAMLAAVSFLRLIAMKGETVDEKIPQGIGAYCQTMVAVAIFGAVINLSALLLIADKVKNGKKLDLFTAKSIVRAFVGGPTWSPFFAGMAVVLTYVPGAHLFVIMKFGLPYAIIGLLYVIASAKVFHDQEVREFKGYPLTFINLWLPAVLVVGVIVGHYWGGQMSILAVIALSALLVSTIGLCISGGFNTAGKELKDHVVNGLPKMGNELILFLAAGVLAVGLRSLVAATTFSLPFDGGFDAAAATILLGGIVLLSLLAVHPIISISVAAPLLAPLNPDPQLLALAFVFSWSLGACANPLSGLNLIFQAHYGIASIKLASVNWPYVAIMFVLATLFLHGISIMNGI